MAWLGQMRHDRDIMMVMIMMVMTMVMMMAMVVMMTVPIMMVMLLLLLTVMLMTCYHIGALAWCWALCKHYVCCIFLSSELPHEEGSA